MVHHFRQVAANIGLTTDVHQTVTMASIVEKETAVPEERPLVASVYYNRLTKRMALDADPSVIYAKLLEGHLSGRSASRRHADQLALQHLPLSRPASRTRSEIPGGGSLEAAMHPAAAIICTS